MPEISKDERLKRKLTLAEERDTRVVITRTIDTLRVLDIVRNADRGIRILRANILIRFKPEEAIPLLDEYQKAIEGLDKSAQQICQKVGIPYRTRRSTGKPAQEGDPEKDDKTGDQSDAAAEKEEKKKK